ncbi:MAG: OmpH family outer membrane protein [Cyclobacteriaceae bacterium]|nr:OmpH family outer membrane protein [Cyclobacteriaceae bacterium]MCH8517856.1 OmpH family outer membrane protein [Cyclobacteriaceae bacterium]
MKNLSLILNVVLFIAVAILYGLHFSGGGSTQDEIDEKIEMEVERKSKNLPIAYVNIDSLLANYTYFTDAAQRLEQRRGKLETELQNRARGLESEIQNFQQTAGGMTMSQARAKEEELMQKQQNLQRYQQNIGQELSMEEMKVNNELYENVADYLKNYGKRQNFQVVLTYSRGSGVLYANDSLDITSEVVRALNRIYAGGEADEEAAEEFVKELEQEAKEEEQN